jgi:phosphate starvation-inducible PhoH-like protein
LTRAAPRQAASPAPRTVELDFDDNALVPLLYGEHDTHLVRIEHLLGVTLASRGNHVTISGPDFATRRAELVLSSLWDRLSRGQDVGAPEVDAAVKFSEAAGAQGGGGDKAMTDQLNAPGQAIRTQRRVIHPRTPNQAGYIKALQTHELVFGLGPAGTGKTYLAVAQAVAFLVSRKVDRIILSRPAVEAGERLGFLPGDLKEKVDPYLRPLYDALYDMLPPEQVTRYLETGVVEVAPLAFMRGRTLANSAIILDEAQNTTPTQMKMFLTRMGENGRMVITGDLSQVDLPRGVNSGLAESVDILRGVEGIATIRFTDQDVVRHPLVTRIVQAYQQADQAELELK